MCIRDSAVAAAIAAAAGVDPSAVEIAVIEAADGSVQLVAYIRVHDDAAAAAAQTALGASIGDEASATAALATTGVVPNAAPVVSAPSQMLSVVIPVEGSAADVSEADKAAVAAALAAEAGVDVSAVEIAVIVRDDGSVELVAYITVADDATADAAKLALDASLGDLASATTVLGSLGVVPKGTPVVTVPPLPEVRKCYLTVSVKAVSYTHLTLPTICSV